MIFNFLFSRYFVFTLVTTLLLATLHGDGSHSLSITAFMVSLLIPTIGIYGFMHNRKISELYLVLDNRKSKLLSKTLLTLTFSTIFGYILFGNEIVNSKTDSLIIYLIVTFFALILIQFFTIEWNQFAVREKALTNTQLFNILLDKNNLKTMTGFSLLALGLESFVNPFVIIMFLSIFTFFFLFVPSQYFNQENENIN